MYFAGLKLVNTWEGAPYIVVGNNYYIYNVSGTMLHFYKPYHI